MNPRVAARLCGVSPPTTTIISFNTEQNSFTARMVEQICQIEHYRQEVEQLEGRILDSEEAAEEWLQRYAEDFNRIFSLN
jgi:hypothetical protein